MPLNSSPTFTPHTPTSLVQLLVYEPCSLFSFLLLRLICSRKEKKLLFTTTPVLIQLPSALPRFLVLLTPLSPPTNRAPPTRLTLLTPLHGTTHPCPHEGRPYPSKSFLPATLA